MEEHGSKATNVGVSIILTLAIIAAVVTIVTIALKMTTTGATEATNLSGQMEESKYTRYDNQFVTGDQITSLIKQFENDQICIAVDTQPGGGGTVGEYVWQSSGDFSFDDRTGTLTDQSKAAADPAAYNDQLRLMQDKSSSDFYISPGAKYLCHVIRNATTDAVVGLYFRREA